MGRGSEGARLNPLQGSRLQLIIGIVKVDPRILTPNPPSQLRSWGARSWRGPSSANRGRRWGGGGEVRLAEASVAPPPKLGGDQ